MKLSWMARATDAAAFEQHLKFAGDIALDVIDFHLSGMPRDPAFIMRIKSLCVEAGLPIGYMGGGRVCRTIGRAFHAARPWSKGR